MLNSFSKITFYLVALHVFFPINTMQLQLPYHSKRYIVPRNTFKERRVTKLQHNLFRDLVKKSFLHNRQPDPIKDITKTLTTTQLKQLFYDLIHNKLNAIELPLEKRIKEEKTFFLPFATTESHKATLEFLQFAENQPLLSAYKKFAKAIYEQTQSEVTNYQLDNNILAVEKNAYTICKNRATTKIIQLLEDELGPDLKTIHVDKTITDESIFDQLD